MATNLIHKIYNSNIFWIFLIFINMVLGYLTLYPFLNKSYYDSSLKNTYNKQVFSPDIDTNVAADLNIKIDKNEIYSDDPFMVYTEAIVDNFQITYYVDGSPYCINNNIRAGCVLKISTVGRHLVVGCVEKLRLCDSLIIFVLDKPIASDFNCDQLVVSNNRFDLTIENLPFGNYNLEISENNISNKYQLISNGQQVIVVFKTSYEQRPIIKIRKVENIETGKVFFCN